MNSSKYIAMDVHKESISIAVSNAAGKIVMEGVIETKASMILQFIDGLRGDLQVTFEEGTSAAWLYDLLKPHVTKVVVLRSAKKQVHEGRQPERQDRRAAIGRAAAPQSSQPRLSRRTWPTNTEGVGAQLSNGHERSRTGDDTGESDLSQLGHPL